MDKATQGIVDQAAEWVIRLDEGGLSAQETLAFVNWLRASPLHIREYLRSESAWLALENADAARLVDIDALLRQETASVLPFSGRQPAERAETSGAAAAIRNSRSSWWSIAAAMALVAVAVPLLYFANGLRNAGLFTTALGEQRTIVLDDGSVMELNTASQVRVRFSGTGRDVEMLAGEAFFTVRKDAARPFRVLSHGTEVRAVGTQFNVYRHPDETVVTVLEGLVQVQPIDVQPGGEVLRLAVGDQAVVGTERQAVIADPAAMARAVAWRERKLVFADEPLVNVVAEINRYNTQQLAVSDATLASRRISGVFNVHDPEVIVRFLTRTAGVSVTETPEGGWVLAEQETAGEAP